MDILLTDDDESVRKTVGVFLAARGYRIRTASGGEEALETAIAALRHRAYDYLKKPIQLEELIACIKGVERNRRPEM